MKSNIAKGEDYDRLLKDFLDRGGDLSRCPFETDGYRWEEPPYTNQDEWEKEYQQIMKKSR